MQDICLSKTLTTSKEHFVFKPESAVVLEAFKRFCTILLYSFLIPFLLWFSACSSLNSLIPIVFLLVRTSLLVWMLISVLKNIYHIFMSYEKDRLFFSIPNLLVTNSLKPFLAEFQSFLSAHNFFLYYSSVYKTVLSLLGD